MNIQKYISFLLIVLASSTPILCDDFDESDFCDISESLYAAENCQTITPDFNPSDAFCLLVNNGQFDFLSILGKNLFLSTRQIPKRDLNTLPIFVLFHNNEDDYCKEFNLIPFFNQTTHQYFVGTCPGIKGYLAITDPDIINEIAKLSDLGLIEATIPDFIDLFKDARLEERRAGIMFQWLKSWRKTSLEIKWPLLYQERNFNFTEEEILAIRQSELIPGSNGDEATEGQVRKLVVADLFGFGDLRFRLTTLLHNKPSIKLRLGLELNLPTAFPLKRGLIGSNFSNNCRRPYFNLFQFMDNVLNEKADCAIAEGIQIGFDWAKRLAAMTLQTDLGENRHVILGLIIEPYIKPTEYLTLNSFLTVFYSLPQRETRYFLRAKNPHCFERETYQHIIDTCCGGTPSSCDQEQVLDVLKFFQEQILNTFFPDCVKTIVSPGFMIQYDLAATIDVEDWELMLGLDFWYKQQESLEPKAQRDCYCLCKANIGECWQTKTYFRLLRTMQKRKYDFGVSLATDLTFASYGIGKDFSVGIGFDFHY